MPKYDVTLDRTLVTRTPQRAVVEVEAASAEEAGERALALARQEVKGDDDRPIVDWENVDEEIDDGLDDVEVLEVRESEWQ